MDEFKEDEIKEVYQDYQDIQKFIYDKERIGIDTIHKRDTIKIIADLYTKKQLNKATKKLFQVTAVLTIVAIIQLYNTLKGPEKTLGIVEPLMGLALIIIVVWMLLYICASALMWVWTKIIRKIWPKKKKREPDMRAIHPDFSIKKKEK